MQLLRGLALAALLLMAVVVVASAWLRLAQARPLCVDWPGCRSVQVPPPKMAADATLGAPAVLTAARAAHRLAASTLLLVVLALVVLAARTGPGRPRDASLLARGAGMLALALGLAALGMFTPGARSVAVLLGNLLGGLALLALAWATWRGLQALRSPSAALARWAATGAVPWALQAALGARSGAGFGDVAPVAHLALALLVAPWAAAIGLAAVRQGCRVEGRALIALAALQGLLGALSAALAAPPALVLAHNAAAACGLALLVGLALAPSR